MKSSTPDKAAAIQGDIARTRDDMSKTIGQIEERLSPAHLKEQMADLKQSALGQYHEAKDHVKDDLTRELELAKQKVQEEVHAAKLAVRRELHEAQASVRAATVGKVENMVHDARDAVSDAGTSILDTIRENPVPVAMMAIGIGWMLFGGKKSSSTRRSRASMRQGGNYRAGNFDYDYDYDYDARGGYGAEGGRSLAERGRQAVGSALHSAGEGVSHAAHRVQDGASHLVDQAGSVIHDVGDTVGSVAHRATEGAAHLAHDASEEAAHLARQAGRAGQYAARQVRLGAHRVEEGFESTLRENPLAVGAVALAVGAAIGLALPHTEREDEWMGGAKDRLIDRAQGMAHQALHQAEETVDTLASKADEKVKQVTAGTSGSTPNGNGGQRNSNAHLT